MIIENITGFRKIDRIINKKFPLNQKQEKLLQDYTQALLKHTPVQYVLKEAWFAGMKFYVDKNVLIPRPETEELVEWIGSEIQNSNQKVQNLLDIGTGSGCISIAVKRKFPELEVHAIDVSETALEVAQRNASEQQTEILFHQVDILNRKEWKRLPVFDMIVSNPPYIKESEADQMQQNVLTHEPHIALFVPTNDALLFYRSIADFALRYLSVNGTLFFELNDAHGEDVTTMLSENGFADVQLKKDMQGKDRMIKATYSI